DAGHLVGQRLIPAIKVDKEVLRLQGEAAGGAGPPWCQDSGEHDRQEECHRPRRPGGESFATARLDRLGRDGRAQRAHGGSSSAVLCLSVPMAEGSPFSSCPRGRGAGNPQNGGFWPPRRFQDTKGPATGEPVAGPGASPDEPLRPQASGQRRMRLRIQTERIPTTPAMPLATVWSR